MCLAIRKEQEGQIAQEGIKCFKVLSKGGATERAAGVYLTPYQETVVRLGESYGSDIEKGETSSFGEVYIHKALHSFVSYEGALVDLHDFPNCYDMVIVECFIPKGAIYYLGNFNELNDSYASNALTYTNTVLWNRDETADTQA